MRSRFSLNLCDMHKWLLGLTIVAGVLASELPETMDSQDDSQLPFGNNTADLPSDDAINDGDHAVNETIATEQEHAGIENLSPVLSPNTTGHQLKPNDTMSETEGTTTHAVDKNVDIASGPLPSVEKESGTGNSSELLPRDQNIKIVNPMENGLEKQSESLIEQDEQGKVANYTGTINEPNLNIKDDSLPYLPEDVPGKGKEGKLTLQNTPREGLQNSVQEMSTEVFVNEAESKKKELVNNVETEIHEKSNRTGPIFADEELRNQIMAANAFAKSVANQHGHISSAASAAEVCLWVLMIAGCSIMTYHLWLVMSSIQ